MEYDAVIQNISLTGIMGVYVSFGDSNQQQGFVSYPNLKTKQQKKQSKQTRMICLETFMLQKI